MKELSIKEKAKAYEEALERAKKWYNAPNIDKMPTYGNRIIEEIFPELIEENEDEKIRKELIKFVKVNIPNEERYIAWLEKQGNPTEINPSEFDLRLNKLLKQFETLPKEELASSLSFYLNVVQNDGTYREEKQGEQNINVGISSQLDDQMSADNNESKFNIGDEIKTTNEEPLTITKIDDKGYWSGDLFVCSFEDSTKWKLVGKFKPKFLNGQWIVWHGKCYTVYDNSCGYELLDQDGFITSLEYGTVEVNAHLWTIDDAKDGDVLADNIGVILFKSIRDNNVINYYAYLSGLFAVQKGEEYWGYAVNCALSPATKEQHERFFAAMHNAGYEWDAEKKELKKIDQKPEDKAVPKFKKDDWITDGNSVLHITNIDYGFYQFGDSYNAISIIDKKYHLWTIQDAKDGDVLTDNDYPCIFKSINEGIGMVVYCGINGRGNFAIEADGICNTWDSHPENYCPATKERRTILFQKMKEAGYEWDAEKLELKKIEQKHAEQSEKL